jgi:hypothetical protein
MSPLALEERMMGGDDQVMALTPAEFFKRLNCYPACFLDAN